MLTPVIQDPQSITRQIHNWREKKLTIGLVPTMGALHEGHASLIRRAAKECDRVVVTIFVNPKQFGPSEDLSRYPRSLNADRQLVKRAGGHLVFAPTVSQMYPENFSTAVEVDGLSDLYCGRDRPGHFRGVCTVVLKLFNLIPAHRAYFGEKDFQQVSIIEKMVRDLSVAIKIVRVPIVRQKDGLALSSRNAYLSPLERTVAPTLYKELLLARRLAQKPGATAHAIVSRLKKNLERSEFKLCYAAVVDSKTLDTVKDLNGARRLLIAAKLGHTRLIDNIAL